MIDTFEKANVDVIISNAGGCGSNLKEYHRLLRDDPAYADAGSSLFREMPGHQRIS